MKYKPFMRLLAVILFAPMCSAQINDNFNDNSLNSSIWNTLTPSRVPHSWYPKQINV